VQLNKVLRFSILALKAATIHDLRDDRLHVLPMTAERVIEDAIAANDCLELLAAQQGLIHAVAPVMVADCAGAGHFSFSGRALGVALSE
jgi:hypothetical protein